VTLEQTQHLEALALRASWMRCTTGNSPGWYNQEDCRPISDERAYKELLMMFADEKGRPLTHDGEQ